MHKILTYFNQFRLFLWILSFVFGIILCIDAVGAEAPAQYSAKGRRDPFMPLITQTSRQSPGLIGVESIEDISIEGVVYDPKNASMVIVNGSVLKEGEEQGSVKVLKIQSDGALFSVNGIESFKYQYQPENAKKNKG